MLDSLLQLIHVLASMVWLGGMFFAHFCLRPAAQQLEPPVRIGLMFLHPGNLGERHGASPLS